MALLFNPDIVSNFPRKDAKRILDKIDWLWAERRSIAHWQLGGNLSGYLKRQVGNYRIIYSYDTDTDDITIHMVGLRETIYKDADKRLS